MEFEPSLRPFGIFHASKPFGRSKFWIIKLTFKSTTESFHKILEIFLS
jgi:hypothetical protein